MIARERPGVSKNLKNVRKGSRGGQVGQNQNGAQGSISSGCPKVGRGESRSETRTLNNGENSSVEHVTRTVLGVREACVSALRHCLTRDQKLTEEIEKFLRTFFNFHIQTGA